MLLMMVSMMIFSSCISSSVSSGLFVAANEDWLTGQLFDWMDMSWWTDFKGWFGFTSPAAVPPASEPPGSTPTGGDAKDPKDKYKSNCVYAYTGKDAKSGYINSICVDSKNPHAYWTAQTPNSKPKYINSLRVGKEVKVNMLSLNTKDTSLTVNGKDVNKPVNLDDKGWEDKAGVISASYKSYDSQGKLKRVGDARDENSVYFYADNNGHGYLTEIKSKSSGQVEKSDWSLRYASSMRVGKNVKVWLGNKQNALKMVTGSGTSKVINLKPLGWNDWVVKAIVARK